MRFTSRSDADLRSGSREKTSGVLRASLWTAHPWQVSMALGTIHRFSVSHTASAFPSFGSLLCAVRLLEEEIGVDLRHYLLVIYFTNAKAMEKDASCT